MKKDNVVVGFVKYAFFEGGAHHDEEFVGHVSTGEDPKMEVEKDAQLEIRAGRSKAVLFVNRILGLMVLISMSMHVWYALFNPSISVPVIFRDVVISGMGYFGSAIISYYES